jgi:hypothetical protein
MLCDTNLAIGIRSSSTRESGSSDCFLVQQCVKGSLRKAIFFLHGYGKQNMSWLFNKKEISLFLKYPYSALYELKLKCFIVLVKSV